MDIPIVIIFILVTIIIFSWYIYKFQETTKELQETIEKLQTDVAGISYKPLYATSVYVVVETHSYGNRYVSLQDYLEQLNNKLDFEMAYVQNKPATVSFEEIKE